jgi:2-dehydropantoate 2-reductase
LPKEVVFMLGGNEPRSGGVTVNILLIGAGSLGLLFAGRLASVSANVAVLAHRSAQAELLHKEGVTVEDEFGSHPSVLTPEGLIGPPDWILLMVKQKDITAALMQSLRDKSGEHTQVLCFQNGIGHVERLSTAVPLSRIWLAVTTEAAKKQSDTRVLHTGRGLTSIGPAQPEPEKAAQESQKKLVAALRHAGFACNLSNNMDRIIWNKLLINSVINPLTALLRVCNGQLLSTSYALALMRSLYAEGVTVAEALGIQVADDLWDQLLDVCAKTADNRSSMLQDVEAGRQTEVDWINGSLVQLAAQRGMALPVQQALYQMIKALES